jgi:flagellar basal body-associated protein FliL
MNKKILIPLLVVLLGGGYAGYSMAMPHKTQKLKVNGTIYVLPKAFTINMAGGQYATLTVALLLAPTQSEGVTDPNNPPPTGFGSLPEEAVVRAIITNDVTGQPASALISEAGRDALEKKILSDIKKQTDDLIDAIYFTDLAVQ